jgi:uncharacterized Zn-binding protein involved in type VI secretion
MPPAGRLRDKAHCPADAHGCSDCPHDVIGPAIIGSPDTIINNRPALRVGDQGVHSKCCGDNEWVAVEGSPTVLINNMQAHRLGDQTEHCGGMGKLVEGSSNVLIGIPGKGQCLAAAAQSGAMGVA